MPAYQLIYDNLREAMRFFGQSTGKGEVRAVDQAMVIYSGIEYGVFNICMLDPFPEDITRSLDACARYFSRHSRRWSLWVCEEALAPDDSRKMRSAVERHGLRQISRAPGMTAEALAPPRRELPAIQCIPVETLKHRETFGSLAAICFEIPMGVAREIYYRDAGWNGSYRGFIGVVAGRPVGIVALVRTGGTLGIYSLAIQPESRRLGYGEALLRAAIEHERSAGGVERIVLQSSEPGLSLYKHMGFRDDARFTVYLTK